MPDRFLAYLPLSEMRFTTSERLVERMRELFSAVPMQVTSLGPIRNGDEVGPGFLVGVDDVVLAIRPVDLPLPPAAFTTALDLNRRWDGAPAAMARHSAHVIVGVVTSSHALAAAGAMTFACAALATLLPAVAVVWTNAHTILSPEALHQAALTVAEPGVPLALWVGLHYLAAPGGQVAVLTSGLMPFAGRELEWLPHDLPLEIVTERVIGTCWYLISKGPVIADRETLGIDEEECIRATYADAGQRPGVPVIQLRMEARRLEPPPPPPPPYDPGAAPPRRAFGRKLVS